MLAKVQTSSAGAKGLMLGAVVTVNKQFPVSNIAVRHTSFAGVGNN